jgi:hypothetical protein
MGMQARKPLIKDQTCWDCLLRLLRKNNPLTFSEALRLTDIVRKDSRYQPGSTHHEPDHEFEK